MVESISRMEYPARSNGVATASKPRGAVASLLAKDGKKKTTFLDIRCVPRLSGFSRIRTCVRDCHRWVTHLSFIDRQRLDLSTDAELRYVQDNGGIRAMRQEQRLRGLPTKL